MRMNGISVTPPKLALANYVESLAIYPIKPDCGPTSNYVVTQIIN